MDKKKYTMLVSLIFAAIAVIVLILVLPGGKTEADNGRTSDGSLILTPSQSGSSGSVKSSGVSAPEAETAEAQSVTVIDVGPESSVPLMARRAEASYFTDAAFVGNETVMALGRYDYDGLLTDAAFYEVETVSDNNYVNQIIEDGGYGKVYIGLGGYELAYKVSVLESSLRSAIRSLKSEYPDCIVYIMSVSPVSRYRTSISTAIRMDRVKEYNEMLCALAEELGVWYLEITSALVGEDGYLPSNVTEDGLNYTPAHYQGWYDVLASYYIGDRE